MFAQTEDLWALWDRARDAARLRDRRLILAVDGPAGSDDHASPVRLLPSQVDRYAKVLVLTRPVPRSALGAPRGHPLLSQKRCPQVELATSPHARLFPLNRTGDLDTAKQTAFQSRPEDIDAILGAIDEILEADPEEFIHNYVQRNGNGGGQYLALLQAAVELHGAPSVALVMQYLTREYQALGVYDEVDLGALRDAVRNQFGVELARTFSGALTSTSDFFSLCEMAIDGGFHLWAELDAGRMTPQADAREDALRANVLAGDYLLAQRDLDAAVDLDPGREQRLREEFGFLSLAHEDDRELVAGLWAQLAEGNDFPLNAGPVRDVEDVVLRVKPTGTAPSDTAGSAPAAVTPPRQPQVLRKSEEMEPADALRELLDSIFALDDAHREVLLGWPGWRAAAPAPAPGRTATVDCLANGPRRARCRVGLIDPGRPLTLADLAESLVTTGDMELEQQPDHLVFISPRNDPDPGLADRLGSSALKEKYPFTVQVWSPASGFADLIGQRPRLYAYVYGDRPPRRAPGQTRVPLSVWGERLAPRLRVGPAWRRYVEDPFLHCLTSEDPDHFDEVFRQRVELRAMDGRGRLLDGTLTEQIMDWLRTDEPSLLVLGEFGEGKSFSTYSLSRRLCQLLKEAPGSGVFPLRLPLRELHKAGDARRLLDRRLAEIGGDLHGWRELTRRFRTLFILDGFDEMSVQLTPRAISRNIIALSECYRTIRELKGSKVIITSRGRFFDGGRDEERLLDRIGRPRALHIAPISRAHRIGYLQKVASKTQSTRKLDNLQRLYDPIGLAAKPLFLHMIAETLDKLPTDEFSELILYRTYVNESLNRKIDLLEDTQLHTSRDDLVEKLQDVLSEVAMRLHRSPLKPVFLNDLDDEQDGGLAGMLWNMRADAAPEGPSAEVTADATARIGIRSLLKAVPVGPMDRWPVDFFHRSMREYFVARGIVTALRGDEEKARDVLGSLPPQPEITRFVAELLADSDDAELTERLHDLARSTRPGRSDDYLGGHALTLLNAHCARLPDDIWSGLCFDYAWLPDADLSGMAFRGSSLRHANLDNANLENSDFTDADLTGVRLEETSRVFGLTTTGSQRIFAGYEDRSIREWVLKAGEQLEVRTVATLAHRAERLHCTASDTLIALGGSRLTVLTYASPESRVLATFKVKSMFRPPAFHGDSTLLVQEDNSGLAQAIWYVPAKRRGYGAQRLGDYVDSAQVHGAVGLVATTEGVLVFGPPGQENRPVNLHELPGLSSVAVTGTADTGLTLATGHDDGTVRLSRLSPDGSGFSREELWTRALHDGAVSSLAFFDDGNLVSGGLDKAVCVTPLAADDHHHSRRLFLSIRCQGMRLEGVCGDTEQARLREIVARYQ
ncbi:MULTISPECIES: ubiquitin-like protein Pup [unclassified Streptomyces]|uniref:ubiquitin-like protein Pup n=1 Tax=unclassified Streptomyces TaxID=2593676 RepID=UPI00278C396C|nr:MULTISPECIES: ubiquitin-like protein Pup [unclassified Streptomyces]